MSEQDKTDPETIEASVIEEGKTTAIIAYLTLIGLIVAFCYVQR